MHRRRLAIALRVTLGALAFECALIGVQALFFPNYFYNEFLLGRGWSAMLPPYSEHMTRDAGALYLGFFVTLTWAAVRLSRELVLAAVAGFAVATLPHMVYHAFHLDSATEMFDKVSQVGALALTLVVCVGILELYRRYQLTEPAGV